MLLIQVTLSNSNVQWKHLKQAMDNFPALSQYAFIEKFLMNLLFQNWRPSTESVIEMDNDSDNPQVVVSSDAKSTYHYPMFAKTPVWAIAYCLERVMSWKKYYLQNCTFLELGMAADDAFFIEGYLNTTNPPQEVNKHDKHVPCGPDMKFLHAKHLANDIQSLLSVILYVPLIGRFFSYHHCKNSLSWCLFNGWWRFVMNIFGF